MHDASATKPWQQPARSGIDQDGAELELLSKFRTLKAHQREAVVKLARALSQANARLRNTRIVARTKN